MIPLLKCKIMLLLCNALLPSARYNEIVDTICQQLPPARRCYPPTYFVYMYKYIGDFFQQRLPVCLRISFLKGSATLHPPCHRCSTASRKVSVYRTSLGAGISQLLHPHSLTFSALNAVLLLFFLWLCARLAAHCSATFRTIYISIYTSMYVCMCI